MNLIRRIACAATVAAIACTAVAQDPQYPTKTIRLIIPSTPGGGTDFIARTLSVKLAESAGAGWTLVPENRPGAAGTLGLAETARAKPDGYDLVIGQTANVSLAPWLMKLSFDPAKDLTPVALAVEAPMVLAVAENSPYKTWADLLAFAKANPSKPLNFGTSGTGSVAQVAAEQIQDKSGFKLQHVPYKGSAPALADLMGGHLDLAGTSLASALPLLQSGKIRALAVTSAKRATALPNAPALSELGYPGFNMVEWYGVFGPANLPPAIADRLNAEVNKVLQRPEVRTVILGQGQEPRPESRAAFAAMVKSDNQTSQAIIAKAGIKLE
ncbi:tripartite tricarboxylate transporter substrate binding protein [Xylophilus sp. GOD-11R]|uniref:Bug family tripartite tricarboxylate transporter substrate binding protein n=1 Tax=Xylophilus sp. GOD-11R TaxID=3089814 RepID=UPI00298C22BD|nr:tripartite tricarboxylate transporter substrate binding protein [Xylophilus sp. GOD-11R]WPB56386.1 tripartite tricarboxylate transporter substrate binding protein [Xylophilus sp. GOD-11R]